MNKNKKENNNNKIHNNSRRGETAQLISGQRASALVFTWSLRDTSKVPRKNIKARMKNTIVLIESL